MKLQKVQFSAIAPKSLSRGEYSIINIIMFEESSRHIVDELVNSMDEPSQETKSGIHKVNEGASIKVILNSPDFSIEDNTETGVWQGEYLDFSFVLQIPDNYKKRQILLTAIVYINDVIATKLKFIVKCSSHSEQQITVSRSDIFSAFISYASQDRNRVAAIIQGMKKARPDLDVFFDVDSLRSGDDWELALHEEIKRRDVLFLCWSHFARESKWVDAEWRYALEQKGADCIEPVPIESPDICPPPAELNFKHFNDKLLYIINSVR
ncbi:MAG: toll/interleukin-1 receptor domain-containing protein [Blautia sp.]|nr:toll/interleukin-1 receptor domain-containing protein [Blautia sp.]